MTQLASKTAIVTGATSGIGRAIALALLREGATVYAVGRSRDRLQDLAAESASLDGTLHRHEADLAIEDDLRRLASRSQATLGDVDVLIHSAAMISLAPMASADLEDLDRQYATNVRAPYLLTQALLPTLTRTKGQIVFVNSTAGVRAGANTGQYAMTKHALKALADSVREEVNPSGIRVLTIYPGRTATPMQAFVAASEGIVYRPDQLIQPDDVAAVVLNALTLPRSTEVTDVDLRPMKKPS